MPLPELAEICRHAPLFADLDDAAIDRLAERTTKRVLARGEVLVEQGSAADAAYVIARGAVAVVQERDGERVLLDVLGSGDVAGEMGLLDDAPRNASLEALTTVTVGEIRRADFEALMDEIPGFRDAIWEAVGRRRFDNHVRGLAGFEHLGHEDRLAWFAGGRHVGLAEGAQLPACELAFVYQGALDGWSTHEAPALVRPAEGEVLVAAVDSRVVLLPARPPHPRASRGPANGVVDPAGRPRATASRTRC